MRVSLAGAVGAPGREKENVWLENVLATGLRLPTNPAMGLIQTVAPGAPGDPALTAPPATKTEPKIARRFALTINGMCGAAGASALTPVEDTSPGLATVSRATAPSTTPAAWETPTRSWTVITLTKAF